MIMLHRSIACKLARRIIRSSPRLCRSWYNRDYYPSDGAEAGRFLVIPSGVTVSV
jgi:hypothetical protein